jgi:acyl-coenzyme A thioesterase PaaI-like protein
MTTIGASVISVASGAVELAMPFSDKQTQQHGFIHAGIVTMLCDTNLLSPARGERFIAHGRVVRPGKKVIVCLGEVFAEDFGRRKQVALMTASMMVMDTASGLRD